MKKVGKILVLFIILAQMVPMCAFADSSLSVIEVTDEDIALSNKLSALGVITNEYTLSDYVTRGEMADIIVTFMRMNPAEGKSVFSDVTAEHKNYNAISALYDMEIISGDENGLFHPDENVTYNEAMVFIINAIGHKSFAVREGGYPTGYLRIAIMHDMLEDLSISDASTSATLPEIYSMLSAALTAATVHATYSDGNVTYTVSDTETFLSEVYDITVYRDIVKGTASIEAENIKIGENQIFIGGKIYDVKGYDDKKFYGKCVDYYVSKSDEDKILYIEETKNRNKTIKLDAKDVTKSTTDRIYYEDDEFKERHIAFDDAYVQVVYNNRLYDTYGVIANILPDASGYVEALDNNRDGVYDVLFIYAYKNVVVKTIDSYSESIVDDLTGKSFDLSTDGQTVEFRFVGQSRKVTFSSVQTGDVLSIAESKDTPKVKHVYISRLTAFGIISAQESGKGYLINDTWYEKAASYQGTTLAPGLSGTFYLDVNGDIAAYKEGTTVDGKLAVMSGIDYERDSLSKKISVRLFGIDGVFVYADLKEKVRIDDEIYNLTDKDDFYDVIEIISNDRTDTGVETAYLVSYTLDENNKLSKLNRWAPDGSESDKILATSGIEMTARTHSIISFLDDDGVRKRARYSGGGIISVPTDLEELNRYSIYTGFRADWVWSNTHTKYTLLDSYAVYSTGITEVPVADVMIFRGMGAVGAVSEASPIGAITSIGKTVDKDGVVVPKLYMGDKGYALASEVNFEADGTAYSKLSAEDARIAAALKAGIAIQYALDIDGNIGGIKLVAEEAYDQNGALKLKTRLGKDIYIVQPNIDNLGGEGNVAIGTVKGCDPVTNQILYTANGVDYYLYTSGAAISIYRCGDEKLTLATLEEIVAGDQFVVMFKDYYHAQQIVVFR